MIPLVTVATTLTNKTGFALASTGLDSIATTQPSGVPSTFREILVWLYMRFANKATKTSTQIKVYATDNTTVVTTQTISDDSVTQTQGKVA